MLEIIPYIGDTTHYPLVVLGYACMLAFGFPVTFFVDTVCALVGSLFNKDMYVQLGAYKSHSRYWMNGIAGSGQGKSPTVKPLIQILLSVLRELASLGRLRARELRPL